MPSLPPLVTTTTTDSPWSDREVGELCILLKGEVVDVAAREPLDPAGFDTQGGAPSE